MNHLVSRLTFLLGCFAMLMVLPGCPVNLNRVPGDTDKLKDPQTGGEYYLYVPSWHNNDQKWPVIVTCQGTEPYDTAWSQIHEWRRLAEQFGILVVAPKLQASDSARTISPEDQIRRQRHDEQVILSTLQRTITSLNGDPNRVFLVGWSGGGYDVYYTGLRHPEIFRAIAVRMGLFDEKFLPDVKNRIDVHQPVFIFLAAEDFPVINTQCRKAHQWLLDQGMKRVTLREIPGAHERKPEVPFRYLKDAMEQYSFVRLNAIKGIGGHPLTVQFYAHVDPKPTAVVWEFGDQKFSNEISPRHRYDKPGLYEVKVTVVTHNTAKTERKILVDLADNQ